MTKVTYCSESCRLKAEGHADFGEYGKDPVCAGLTTLLGTAIAALNENGIKHHVIVDEQEAVIDISAEPLTAQSTECRMILDTIATGVKEIAETHPENVSYERFKWRED